MKHPLLPRAFAGLGARMMVVLLAGVLVSGIGFELLLIGLTHHWLYQEMDFRTRSLAAQVADRSETSLLVGDRVELNREIRRAAGEIDVAGVTFFADDGRELSDWSSESAPPERDRLDPKSIPSDGLLRQRRGAHESFLEIIVPIRRGRHHAGSLTEQATQLFDLPAAPPASETGPLGWVRLTVSTARAEEAVRTAAQVGLVVLLLVLLVNLFAVSGLAGVIVRPLREVSELAREIAAGQLDRRLPVRSGDELGTLAESMNTMTEALTDAQQKARDEADALRSATAAMVAIARGARAAHDPSSVFSVVAAEVQCVTGCQGVALAIPSDGRDLPRFAHFEPALPWGGVESGDEVDPDLIQKIAGSTGQTVRFDPVGSPGEVARGLAEDGFRSALAVPLQFPGAPPALLMLVSRDIDGFPSAQADVVAALASHLSSALHAAQLNERLERTFDELQRTHQYLVQSEMLRVAGEMASGVAHEFNNVLGAILGRAQLLHRLASAGQLATPDLLTSLNVIERAARDGSETGRRLRQFGRSSMSETTEAIDLSSALRDAVEFTRPRWENEAHAAGRSIELSIDAEPGVWVEGHGHELREVFTNLILNAADALPQGGHIRLQAAVCGDRASASVEDDGIGMDEETQRRIFEPFFTTKGEFGTGLGMSVVYGLVQRHGGEIAVSSVRGEGTRLALSFPLGVAPAVSGVPDTDPVVDASPMPALEVMIVDDDAAVRDVLRDVTEALGHHPVAFDSGEAAAREFLPGRFQLVMTDLGMPGMTGWQLASHVRALDADVTIAFVTGWGEEVSHEAMRGAGADLVVAKPFTIEDVERVARAAIAGRHLPRAA